MDSNLQDKYFKNGICFGCGPKNDAGLRIKSIVVADKVICLWRPSPEHQAFPGVINGGILGALIDCHANWSAAWYLMKQAKAELPPCTVTAQYQVQLLKPTPLDSDFKLIAECAELNEHSAKIQVDLYANDVLTVKGGGTFVAVKPGHPAYHRW